MMSRATRDKNSAFRERSRETNDAIINKLLRAEGKSLKNHCVDACYLTSRRIDGSCASLEFLERNRK